MSISQNEKQGKKVKNKKSFVAKILDKLDKKMEEKSKKSSCCGSSDKDKSSSCC